MICLLKKEENYLLDEVTSYGFIQMYAKSIKDSILNQET